MLNVMDLKLFSSQPICSLLALAVLSPSLLPHIHTVNVHDTKKLCKSLFISCKAEQPRKLSRRVNSLESVSQRMLDMTEHFAVTNCQQPVRFPGKCKVEVYCIYSVLWKYVMNVSKKNCLELSSVSLGN